MILTAVSDVTSDRTRDHNNRIMLINPYKAISDLTGAIPRDGARAALERELFADRFRGTAGRADGFTVADPLHEPLVLILGRRLGAIGQHHRVTVGQPVDPPQPRVVQDRLVVENKQALLVDRTCEYVEQGTLDWHDQLPPARDAAWAAALSAVWTGKGPGSRSVPAGCLDSTTTATPAASMPPSRSASAAGLAG